MFMLKESCTGQVTAAVEAVTLLTRSVWTEISYTSCRISEE
jgi:hypothetical protein